MTVLRAWNWDPAISAGLAYAAIFYAVGTWRLWRRAGVGTGLRVSQAAAFAGALAVLFTALISPLDAVAGVLFSAHMMQHLLLILVAAPLLVYAAPGFAMLWALPAPLRRSFGRPGRTLQPAWRFLSRPAVAWSIFVAVMWLWHLPMLYDAALRSPLLHAFEHACFLGAALLFWWPLLRPFGSRTASRPFAVPYLFLASLQGSALGAFITFAPRPLYSGYAVSVVSSLTPLQDQQLAGLIMWLPGSLFYLAVAALFFVAWLGRTGAPLAAPALLEGERS